MVKTAKAKQEKSMEAYPRLLAWVRHCISVLYLIFSKYVDNNTDISYRGDYC